MDKEIVNILSSHGCKYMADDYKEMIEEIVAFVKKREKAINYTRCSEQLPVITNEEITKKAYEKAEKIDGRDGVFYSRGYKAGAFWLRNRLKKDKAIV